MRKEIQKERDILFNGFLERTFFTTMRKKLEGNYNNLELMISAKCDNTCKYCYFHNFGDKLTTPKSENKANILKNTDLLLSWLKEKELYPQINVYSGGMDPLLSFEVIDKVLDSHIENIVYPSNINFLDDESQTKIMIGLLEKARSLRKGLNVSASFDGKYVDENRSSTEFDYDKRFEFCAKYNVGFHPVIYSNKIERWKDNFLWFMEMFEKYNIPHERMYMLEVRNTEWSVEQTREFGEFVSWLMKWLWKKFDTSPQEFANLLLRNSRCSFNVLGSFLWGIGRGLGCSVQNFLMVRVGDLQILPCHRTAYSQFLAGEFAVENNKITGITAKNVEVYITIGTLSLTMLPYCEACIIKNLCLGGCPGSQFETTGDLFTPIPSVCRLEMVKVTSLLKVLKELGVLPFLLEMINHDKVRNIQLLEREGFI